VSCARRLGINGDDVRGRSTAPSEQKRLALGCSGDTTYGGSVDGEVLGSGTKGEGGEEEDGLHRSRWEGEKEALWRRPHDTTLKPSPKRSS
jgi:hypothetical protein